MSKHENKDKNLNYHVLTSNEFKTFSSQPRFSIMLLLFTHESVRVKDLALLLNLSKGNLDHHLRILEQEKLIIKNVKIFPKRLYSSISVTEKGKKQFKSYVKKLKQFLP
jgi:DNA-binding MarR family transcriptional regulator